MVGSCLQNPELRLTLHVGTLNCVCGNSSISNGREISIVTILKELPSFLLLKMNPLHATDDAGKQGNSPCLWNQGRNHQKSKTRVSVAQQNVLPNFIKKKYKKEKRKCSVINFILCASFTDILWYGRNEGGYFVFITLSLWMSVDVVVWRRVRRDTGR